MQVPEHLVSLYVATCGQNGQNLGSDEKEIIFLVYTVLDSISGQIIGEKQILVRPEGNFNKDAAAGPAALLDASNSNSNLTNAAITNNEKLNYEINSAVNERICNLKPNTTNNNNINNNNAAAISSNTNNGNSLVRQNSQNELAVVAVTITVPAPVKQDVGVTLSEAIEESDLFLRSLVNNNDKAIETLQIITDGQLPLRQSLHREACVKDITLPTYYGRFSDLRKEYVRYKSGDLSRALVPVKDIKKIMQLPPTPLPPQSIQEILTDLSLPSCEETDFFLRESRDMVSVIKFLLKAGHKFYANEIVNLVLEPGICSIDEEIDGNCIVRARGLPWQSSDQDIAKFFRGLNVAKGGVALCLSPLGRRNGEALIRFISQEHRDMALKRHKHHIGSRYIEVYRANGEDFLAVAGGASNEAKAFLSKGAQVIIRMRGLPYDCTAKQVLDFFTAGDSPCNVLDGAEGVLFVKKPDGRATGDAFVLFANEADAPKALSRHRESIGQRYIELFRSTTAEVQQVLNRSLDPKTYEVNQQPPLIAQLPTMPLSLLPQHFITSGTAKNCIRLRGLPYEALVEHILHFLDDFAKHIIYQGVHMVINAQGQPSGEAFIQMDTEESARLCAQRKHNQFMVFGKKYRYIEVFQCSGDDMNLVLNGGLQSVGTATGLHHPHHHHAGGKQPPLLSPGASLIGAPFIPHFAHFGQPPQRAFIATPTAPRVAQTRPHPSAHHPAIAAAAAFYQQSVYPIYWPYPSPPVSPTTYFSAPAHSPGANGHHVYPLDFIPASYAISPTSPLGTLAPTPTAATAAGIVISNKTPLLQLAPPTPKHYSIQTVAPNVAAVTTTTIRHNGLTAVPLPTSKTNTLQQAIKGDTKPIVVVKETPPLPPPPSASSASATPTTATPPSLTLLAINTCDQLIKTTSPTSTATTAASMENISTGHGGAKIVPQKQCVELFIS